MDEGNQNQSLKIISRFMAGKKQEEPFLQNVELNCKLDEYFWLFDKKIIVNDKVNTGQFVCSVFWR